MISRIFLSKFYDLEKKFTVFCVNVVLGINRVTVKKGHAKILGALRKKKKKKRSIFLKLKSFFFLFAKHDFYYHRKYETSKYGVSLA